MVDEVDQEVKNRDRNYRAGPGDSNRGEVSLRASTMTNVYSLDGLLVFSLLFVCTCAYFQKVPRLRSWLLSEKKGVWGVFYKGHSTMASTLAGSGLRCPPPTLCPKYRTSAIPTIHLVGFK
ncbi:hypothetical protein FKM82_016706, partial [Ascaphus truei]